MTTDTVSAAPTKIPARPKREVKPKEEVVNPLLGEVFTGTLKVGKDSYEVKYIKHGMHKVIAETVYKEVPLPGSQKTTKVIVATKGTQVAL